LQNAVTENEQKKILGFPGTDGQNRLQ